MHEQYSPWSKNYSRAVKTSFYKRKINWNSFRFIGEEEDVVEGDETIPLQDMNKNGFNNGEAEDAVSNTTDKTNLTVNQNGHAADTVVSIVSSTPETNTNNR